MRLVYGKILKILPRKYTSLWTLGIYVYLLSPQCGSLGPTPRCNKFVFIIREKIFSHDFFWDQIHNKYSSYSYIGCTIVVATTSSL